MKPKQKRIIKSLDRRISFYRRCMVGIFFLGLLAGASVLCRKSKNPADLEPDRIHIGFRVLFCFSIAVTGIATGSAYRRRIRHLKDHRNRILMRSNDGQVLDKPGREYTITEIQTLFGILFFLVALVACIRYPLPNLPDPLNTGLLQLILTSGFIFLCWISVSLERKNPLIRLNPLQDFVEMQQKQARIHGNRPYLQPSYWASDEDFSKDEPPPIQANRSMHS